MSEKMEFKFEAKVRTQLGKAHSNRMRREGRIPAVLYGQDTKPTSLELAEREIETLISKTMGANALLNMQLTAEGGTPSGQTVMFKEIQREPVKNKLTHVDF